MKTILLLILLTLGVEGCRKDEWQNYEMLPVTLVSGDSALVILGGVNHLILSEANNSDTIMVLYGRELKVSNIGLNESVFLVRTDTVRLRSGMSFATEGKKFGY